MDAFDLDVFGRVGDDYEAIHTIRGDLERDLARPISVDEVGAALLRLVSLGFIDAFKFDAERNAFCRVKATVHPTEELWFLTNARGRAEYERM